MSVYFYDEALLQKLKRWTEKSEIQIYSPEDTKQLFQVIADKTNDKPIQLPIICLRRNAGYEILNFNKQPLTYDGMSLESWNNIEYSKGIVEPGNTIQLNAIPISISYQLDVYTRYLKEADSYIRNFIFNIINYPTLQVVVPYNDLNFTHNANIRVSSTVSDNSDIPERLITGQFTRMSLDIDIDDAYLWDVKVRNNVIINGEGISVQYPKDESRFITEQIKVEKFKEKLDE